MAGSANSADGDLGFQIAPMVDVVFVLMLFFMACAGSQVSERELNVQLPSGRVHPDPSEPSVPVMVAISPDGQISINDQPLGAPGDHALLQLRLWLRGNRDQFGDADPVVIQPQPETRNDRIIDVLNALHASGVKNLSFS